MFALASSQHIDRLLADRIDRQHRGLSLVVGVVDAKGRRVIARSGAGYDEKALDADTIFEIGSITKSLTSLLLAQMVEAGDVDLHEPVADLLCWPVPAASGQPITLLDLATHTSGLPCLPDNFAPADDADPYSDYSVDQLRAFLTSHIPLRRPGIQFEYSNLGVGVLGHALAVRAGVDFATLLRQRVLAPLHLDDTVVDLTSEQAARLIRGHGPDRMPAANWHTPVLAGCGGHLSSANDLLTFLEAELGFRRTPLARAMTAQLGPRRPTDAAEGPQTALGLFVWPHADGETIWHDGATGGYCAFMGFDCRRGIGVVVLSNLSMPFGISDLGLHLLRGTPLDDAP